MRASLQPDFYQTSTVADALPFFSKMHLLAPQKI
jgi:hypothetical protein